jgi:hypothetical protein
MALPLMVKWVGTHAFSAPALTAAVKAGMDLLTLARLTWDSLLASASAAVARIGANAAKINAACAYFMEASLCEKHDGAPGGCWQADWQRINGKFSPFMALGKDGAKPSQLSEYEIRTKVG